MRPIHNISLTQRFVIGGALFGLILPLSVLALVALVRAIYPDVIDSILALITGLPVYLVIYTLALAIAVTPLWILLRKYPPSTTLLACIAGVILAIEAIIALRYAFPDLHDTVTMSLLYVGASTAVFFIARCLLFLPVIVRLGIAATLIVVFGYVLVLQYHTGTQRAQLNGLKNMGYTLYVPRDRVVENVRPYNNQYDGYKDGVTITLEAQGASSNEKEYLYESKAPATLPSPRCGAEYLDSEALQDKYTCKLVSDTNGVKVYLKELRYYARYYDNFQGSREYFAIIDTTLVQTSATYHYEMDAGGTVTKGTPQTDTEVEETVRHFNSLRPAQENELHTYTARR